MQAKNLKISGSKGEMSLLLGPMVILLLFAVFIDGTEALGFSWGLFPDLFFGLWLMVKPKDGESETRLSQPDDEEEDLSGREEEYQIAFEGERQEEDDIQNSRPAQEKTKNIDSPENEDPYQKQKGPSTRNESANKAERADGNKAADRSGQPKANEPQKQVRTPSEPARHEPQRANPQPPASKNRAKSAKAAKKTKWLKKLRYFTFISGAIPFLSILPMWTILVWSEITSM